MTTKPKILMCSEASFLSSGYSVYAREILKRLYAKNKYEIAEFASYGMPGDSRDQEIPWRYYPNAVNQEDPRFQEYSSSGDNSFGKWRFDRVVYDFKPDIVFDIRDFWMNSYQRYSPLRPYYRWAVMPTVDSYPQQEEWLDVYMDADAVLSYSEWGGHVLSEQTNNLIKYCGSASPGVDLNIFKPIEKNLARKQLGINADARIIGTVMRNQKRKLLPDLFQSFRILLNTYQKNNSADGKDLYLYVHTTYPDAGWNIPSLLKENEVAKRVLFTYFCKKCRGIHAHTFNHVVKHCPYCKQKSAVFPAVTDGVSSEQLSLIYNVFDIYVQYAICEGFGMPQVEAAACGVPLASVDYSAMTDIIKNLNAFSIPPDRYFKELETEAFRCYPNNGILVKTLFEFFSMSNEEKQQKSKLTRELTENKYTWDNAANLWESVFDSLMLQPTKKSWTGSNNAYYKKAIDYKNLSSNFNESFSAFKHVCYNNLNEEDIYSMRNLSLLKHSDYGFVMEGFINTKPYHFEDMINFLNKNIENRNLTKYALANPDAVKTEDFINYANDRTKNNV